MRQCAKVYFQSNGDTNVYQNSGDFTRIWDFTWRVSDCEELVGVTPRR